MAKQRIYIKNVRHLPADLKKRPRKSPKKKPKKSWAERLQEQREYLKTRDNGMKKIYLACPYSHPDPKERKRRFELANKIAAHLMLQGHLVFSPLSHSCPIAYQIMETELDHDFWLKQDAAFLDWCTEMYIICIDGTYDSYGVNWESMNIGNKPITFIDENYNEKKAG